MKMGLAVGYILARDADHKTSISASWRVKRKKGNRTAVPYGLFGKRWQGKKMASEWWPRIQNSKNKWREEISEKNPCR